ncbi:MAG: hypothetical protein DRJ67_09895 [Thermoprotei archaeon]|nr:MAG: hypothetical protein DRJ67_09895 [Thermoprotei archaeon]
MGEILESRDGFKWYVEREDHRLPLNDGEYSVRLMLYRLASSDAVFVDVGAHVGEYTVRMARVYGRVIAFEPNPLSFNVLKRNLELNGIYNVTLFRMACGSGRGRMKLFLFGGSSTLLRTVESSRVVEVEVVRLDDVIDHADVVKIDVEGWEEEVVKGAMGLIKRCKPVLIIEHHEYRGYEECKGMKERIIEMLPDYYHFDLNGVHTLYVPKGYDLTKVREAIAWHWINKAIKNLEEDRPWYYGFPRNWWYGAGIVDIFLALPDHVIDEREWIEKA